MRTLLFVVVVAACSTKSTVTPRPELVETMRDFADRTCACETDKECVRAIRDEWDGVKRDVLAHGLGGDALRDYETELQRFRACGDAAGLTIWLK